LRQRGPQKSFVTLRSPLRMNGAAWESLGEGPRSLLAYLVGGSAYFNVTRVSPRSSKGWTDAPSPLYHLHLGFASRALLWALHQIWRYSYEFLRYLTFRHRKKEMKKEILYCSQTTKSMWMPP